MAQRIVFTGKNAVQCEAFEPEIVTEGKALVQVDYSLISTGTETIVLNRRFSPGTPWDDWVKYPFYPGYCCVGSVVQSSDTTYATDTRVILRYPHASQHTCDISQLLTVPDTVPAQTAVWFALAKIAAQGIKAAQLRFGDSVCIIGAGPIGQMVTRWAFACGARNIVVCDTAPARLEIATKGGASTVFRAAADQIAADLPGACGGKLPRIVFDTTGHAAVFPAVLKLCDMFGTVVLLGDTGYPEKQHLTGDVLGRGLTIRGAHDSHTDSEWTERVIADLWFTMLASGRFKTDGLNTHVFHGADCRKAYDLVDTSRDSTMGVLFDWREQSSTASR